MKSVKIIIEGEIEDDMSKEELVDGLYDNLDGVLSSMNPPEIKIEE